MTPWAEETRAILTDSNALLSDDVNTLPLTGKIFSTPGGSRPSPRGIASERITKGVSPCRSI
jgi:hypothetical protein